MNTYKRDYLLNVLKNETVNVTFTKKNGDERVMRCTLQKELLPARVIKEDARTKEENLEVIPVFDLDANAWRSFRVDSVEMVQPV